MLMGIRYRLLTLLGAATSIQLLRMRNVGKRDPRDHMPRVTTLLRSRRSPRCGSECLLKMQHSHLSPCPATGPPMPGLGI
jgi:hypothetical protein